MARVYKVRHEDLDATRALKVLQLRSSPKLLARFRQEGHIAATLAHPNIVQVTDMVTVDGQPGLVMEYVDGPDLDAFIQAQRGHISLQECQTIGSGIIHGVRAVHDAGHLHRDLKPANVMLVRVDGAWIPKITDFGLSKVLRSLDRTHLTRTRSGAVMGSPGYMAPEQCQDAKSVDVRADIFSLGCILYELLCRVPAFDGADIFELMARARAGVYRPVKDLRRDVPEMMIQAVHGALAPDRDVRIPDCNALLAIWSGREPFDVPPIARPSGILGLILGHPTSAGDAGTTTAPMGSFEDDEVTVYAKGGRLTSSDDVELAAPIVEGAGGTVMRGEDGHVRAFITRLAEPVPLAADEMHDLAALTVRTMDHRPWEALALRPATERAAALDALLLTHTTFMPNASLLLCLCRVAPTKPPTDAWVSALLRWLSDGVATKEVLVGLAAAIFERPAAARAGTVSATWVDVVERLIKIGHADAALSALIRSPIAEGMIRRGRALDLLPLWFALPASHRTPIAHFDFVDTLHPHGEDVAVEVVRSTAKESREREGAVRAWVSRALRAPAAQDKVLDLLRVEEDLQVWVDEIAQAQDDMMRLLAIRCWAKGLDDPLWAAIGGPTEAAFAHAPTVVQRPPVGAPPADSSPDTNPPDGVDPVAQGLTLDVAAILRAIEDWVSRLRR